jgi:hypothetical protein
MVDDERDGKRRVKKSEGGLEYLVSNIIWLNRGKP